MGISEGDEKEQGIENLFEKIMTEIFPNLVRQKVMQVPGSTEGPNQDGLEEAYSKTHHNHKGKF